MATEESMDTNGLEVVGRRVPRPPAALDQIVVTLFKIKDIPEMEKQLSAQHLTAKDERRVRDAVWNMYLDETGQQIQDYQQEMEGKVETLNVTLDGARTENLKLKHKFKKAMIKIKKLEKTLAEKNRRCVCQGVEDQSTDEYFSD